MHLCIRFWLTFLTDSRLARTPRPDMTCLSPREPRGTQVSACLLLAAVFGCMTHASRYAPALVRGVRRRRWVQASASAEVVRTHSVLAVLKESESEYLPRLLANSST